MLTTDTAQCPGSRTPPHTLVDRETSVRRGRVMVDSYGVCWWCRGQFYVTSQGVLHVHRGLPTIEELEDDG